MIVEWFLTLVEGIVDWIVPMMSWGGAEPEAVWDDLRGLASQFASMGVWVDWAAITIAVPLACGVWLACLVVKIARAVASYVPFVGGAG